MYKVYGTVTSRASRVLWLLEEIGAPYELIKTAPRTPEIIAMNGSGKIPVMTDGDAILTDSTAMMTYLADKHGELTYPAGTIERAHQDALMHAVLEEFDAVLWTAMRFSRVLDEDLRTDAMDPGLRWEFNRNLNRFAERIKGPFLQGDKMTIADILFVHCLNWAVGVGYPVENEAVKAYAKSMRARDAFKAMRALDA